MGDYGSSTKTRWKYSVEVPKRQVIECVLKISPLLLIHQTKGEGNKNCPSSLSPPHRVAILEQSRRGKKKKVWYRQSCPFLQSSPYGFPCRRYILCDISRSRFNVTYSPSALSIADVTTCTMAHRCWVCDPRCYLEGLAFGKYLEVRPLVEFRFGSCWGSLIMGSSSAKFADHSGMYPRRKDLLSQRVPYSGVPSA